MACVSRPRNTPETWPKKGVWLPLTFAGYFAVLAVTAMLNGPNLERCTDISLEGLLRAAMIQTGRTVGAVFRPRFYEPWTSFLAAGSSDELANLLWPHTSYALPTGEKPSLENNDFLLSALQLNLLD